jgi:hypothetical protein
VGPGRQRRRCVVRALLRSRTCQSRTKQYGPVSACVCPVC